ncbi:hypothetical protein [Absidia glauca]|uniref:GATA-type domain-containing protein n=1 Tax=Absidia glauca TaxID=4829 RepID=A0A163MAC1_ABSGL|nr:hypothetical protein [Absidia glauca]
MQQDTQPQDDQQQQQLQIDYIEQHQLRQQQMQIQKEQNHIQQQQEHILRQQEQIQEEQAKSHFFSSDVSQLYAERHWSEQLLNDNNVFLFVLSAHGDILYCSDACKGLTGYEPTDVVGHMISDFVHPDDHSVFYDMLDKVFETPLRLTQIQFRWKRKEPPFGFTCLQSFGYSKPDDVPTFSFNNANNIESNYYAFFAIAQSCEPSTFDIVNSLKRENKLLQDRLSQLSASSNSASTFSSYPPQSDSSSSPSSSSSSYNNHPPSVISSWMQSGLHQSSNPWMISPNTNLNTASNPSHLERRNSSPQPMHNRSILSEDTANDKKRKKKIYATVEDYRCSDCGSTNSPEWRRGPLGAKTLCNACGLRWAKKNKKIRIMDQLSNME